MARQLGGEGEERAPAREGPPGREGVVAEAELQAGRGVDDGEALGEDLDLGDAREELGILGAQAREEPAPRTDALLGRRGARRVEDDEAGRARRPPAYGREPEAVLVDGPELVPPPRERHRRPGLDLDGDACRGRRGAPRRAPPTGATRGSRSRRRGRRRGAGVRSRDPRVPRPRCGAARGRRSGRRAGRGSAGAGGRRAQAAAALPPSEDDEERAPRTSPARRLAAARRARRPDRAGAVEGAAHAGSPAARSSSPRRLTSPAPIVTRRSPSFRSASRRGTTSARTSRSTTLRWPRVRAASETRRDGDARDRRLARRVDGEDVDGVGREEGRAEAGRLVPRPREEVRLEEDDEAPLRVRLPRGAERRRDLRRVVGVVVDDEDAVPLALPLEAAGDAGEASRAPSRTPRTGRRARARRRSPRARSSRCGAPGARPRRGRAPRRPRRP